MNRAAERPQPEERLSVLYDPTSGEMTFDGTNIGGPMNRELRKFLTNNIAMIFQDPIESLNPRNDD